MRIAFIIATFGELPYDVGELLHDSRVQEALLRIERGEDLPGGIDKVRKLEEMGLVLKDSLNFPLILKESYSEMRPEVVSMASEIAELVYHGLYGLVGDSRELLSIAALGELDAALDDVLTGKIDSLKLNSGQLIVCGFEGAKPMAYRGTFEETEKGVLCTIEVGRPSLEINSSIDVSSPIFAGSKEMLDMAGSVIEWCLPEAEAWADDLLLTGLKFDMFLYGFTKLVYSKAMERLGSEGGILWDATIRYEITGL